MVEEDIISHFQRLIFKRRSDSNDALFISAQADDSEFILNPLFNLDDITVSFRSFDTHDIHPAIDDDFLPNREVLCLESWVKIDAPLSATDININAPVFVCAEENSIIIRWRAELFDFLLEDLKFFFRFLECPCQLLVPTVCCHQLTLHLIEPTFKVFDIDCALLLPHAFEFTLKHINRPLECTDLLLIPDDIKCFLLLKGIFGISSFDSHT